MGGHGRLLGAGGALGACAIYRMYNELPLEYHLYYQDDDGRWAPLGRVGWRSGAVAGRTARALESAREHINGPRVAAVVRGRVAGGPLAAAVLAMRADRE